jgi:integrase
LVNSEGQPWTADGFRSSWRKACAKAGIVELTFHDLRGSFVTRAAILGSSEPEIAYVTGLKTGDVRSILDAHYLHRDRALGDSAIRKLERRTKTPN